MIEMSIYADQEHIFQIRPSFAYPTINQSSLTDIGQLTAEDRLLKSLVFLLVESSGNKVTVSDNTQ